MFQFFVRRTLVMIPTLLVISALVFIIIQLRWTLPRLRVDQMMIVCWKYLVPMSLACMLFTAIWMLIVHHTSELVGDIMSYAMTALGAFLVALLLWRTNFNRVASKDPLYLNPFT